jgi:hypothetical protein
MSAAAVPQVRARSLQCPGCGGNVELRGFAHTLSATCLHCHTVIDTSSPQLRILQRFGEKARVKPIIPLGQRGKFDGNYYECIGFQVRTVEIDGEKWSWHEYLLFNPYYGFRYLIHYNGHWSSVLPLRGLPTFTQSMGRKAAVFAGQTYKHFSTSTARTTFVMGEFPWQVRAGEQVTGEDYIAPPLMLSSEITKDEITWSQGVYMTGAEVWQAFQLPGSPPPAQGIYLSQPNPHSGKPAAMWRTTGMLLLAWVALLIFLSVSGSREKLFEKSFYFKQEAAGEHSFVTDYFELKNGPANVKIDLKTDLSNSWTYFHLSLINETTGQGYDFGREVSYYSGSDSDGSWSEGSKADSVTVPRVPAGRYYLRIEPEMEASATATPGVGKDVSYSIGVTRAGPPMWPLFLALPFLLIPPIVVSAKAGAFEGQRWNESDYSAGSSSSDDDSSSSGDDD